MRSIRLPMNPLDFEALTQLGRSIIPAAAPQWTDHNTHDPGIMLLELLSWIAEAQMYGISRTRRDERIAFAQLLGLAPRGPLPASGLVWATPGISPAPWAVGHVVAQGTPVTPDLSEPPAYVTTASVELTTARLIAVYTRFQDGSVTDWTSANTHDGATFMPFGTDPKAGDRLLFEFDGPLVGDPSNDAILSIGVRIVNSARAADDERSRPPSPRNAHRLAATLQTDDGEQQLRIVSDTTEGLLRTGVLLLRFPAGVTGADERSVIALHSATGGFMRAPRFQQIAPNVLPIEQVTRARDQRQFGTGLPDQIYLLQSRGLIFPFAGRPMRVTVHDAAGSEAWTRVRDFDRSGPDDRHYVLDETAGSLRFGNGVNGRCLAPASTLDVEYFVSEGARGNQPADLSWRVTGISGVFGSNVAPIEGGSDARGLPDLRRLARQRISTARPVVTSADLEAAAVAFTDLGVTRAHELPPLAGCRVRGTRVLLVVGPHDDSDQTARPESDEFLSEIHARIAPRLALGQSLEVIAARYVAVQIDVSITAAPRVDPEDLRERIVGALRRRLAIVPGEAGPGWPLGRDLTATVVSGWIRKIEGVAGVGTITLSSDPPSSSDGVLVLGRTALPTIDVANSQIRIERSVDRTLQRSRAEAKR